MSLSLTNRDWIVFVASLAIGIDLSVVVTIVVADCLYKFSN